MAVEIFDPDGKNIEDTGMPGELVCTRPHPSMPVYFWADKNDEKYRNAYFNKFAGKALLMAGGKCRSLLSRRLASWRLHG